MRMTTIALLLCGTALPALAQDQGAVRQASQRFASAMSSGDATAAASMFTDDAVVLPPGRQEVKSRPQVQMFLNNMTRRMQNLQYTSEDIRPMGDNAARELGTFSFRTKGRNGGSPQDVTGRYLLVWERSGSDWKISADMWNRQSNGPGDQGGGKGRGAGRGGPGGAGGAGGPNQQDDVQ